MTTERTCPWCGYAVPRVARADRVWCGDACRMAAHRNPDELKKRVRARITAKQSVALQVCGHHPRHRDRDWRGYSICRRCAAERMRRYRKRKRQGA